MFIVRKEQVDAVGAALLAQFAQRLLPVIRAGFSDELAHQPDAAVLLRMQAALRCARRYGVESDRGLRAFVELDVLFGPALDQHRDFEMLFLMTVEEPVLIHNLLAVAGFLVADEAAADSPGED